jgi:hypothetical protein
MIPNLAQKSQRGFEDRLRKQEIAKTAMDLISYLGEDRYRETAIEMLLALRREWVEIKK